MDPVKYGHFMNLNYTSTGNLWIPVKALNWVLFTIGPTLSKRKRTVIRELCTTCINSLASCSDRSYLG